MRNYVLCFSVLIHKYAYTVPAKIILVFQLYFRKNIFPGRAINVNGI